MLVLTITTTRTVTIRVVQGVISKPNMWIFNHQTVEKFCKSKVVKGVANFVRCDMAYVVRVTFAASLIKWLHRTSSFTSALLWTPLEVVEHPGLLMKSPVDLIQCHHGVNGIVANVGKKRCLLQCFNQLFKSSRELPSSLRI
jgi:hypothetical protein